MTRRHLTIVGTGIKREAHLTLEARQAIEKADKLFYLVNNTQTGHMITALNQSAEDLSPLYQEGKERIKTYQQMVQKILTAVRQQQNVCAVFYGHPGIFVLPAMQAMHQALSEGYTAIMQPGISAEDCLFADLGIDPAQYGCQSYEATDFLVRPRQFDTHSNLILWQIGVVGNPLMPTKQDKLTGLTYLVQKLCQHYPATHTVYIYEAATEPQTDPFIQKTALSEIPNKQITPISTLYLPPLSQPKIDQTMVQLLGLLT